MKKAILYINQFFGGVGGEAEADFQPIIKEGPVGPGEMLQSLLKDATITHTIICGDNFINSNKEEALATIDSFINEKEFDIFLAGPAFQSGRYGMSCGEICKYVNAKYGVPAITSMNAENPGVDAYREEPGVHIMQGNKSASKLRNDAKKMATIANKFLAGEEILCADDEGYFGHGIRKIIFTEKTSGDRVVDMLLAKINGEPYNTEYKIEVHDVVEPAKAVADVKQITVALVTTGGLVPVGNPDRIPSGTASVWKAYRVTDIDEFKLGEFYSVHGGFSTNYVNDDPETLVPLGPLKEALNSGAFKAIHPVYYTTTGNLTSLKEAHRMGKEIAADLNAAKVDAVILTST